MKKFFLLILFLIPNNLYAENKIVYLDVQYIIDNSQLGLSYKNKIKKDQNKNRIDLSIKEKIIKEKELEINNQKNILKQDELNKKVAKLNELLKDYQKLRNKLNNEVIENKKQYSIKILNILNPLLTNYVEKNNIILVVEKKNILVGIKSLDITNEILNILNEETKKNNQLNEN
mgnify:CR=1 FL=1